MANHVKSIYASAIHGRIDIEQNFEPGINVLYGKNGCGKTTLLHILANALKGHYERFAFLKFDSIRIELDDDTRVVISREKVDKEVVVTVQHPGVNSKPITFTVTEVQRSEREFVRNSSYPRRAEVPRLPQLESLNETLPAAYFPAFRSTIEAWRKLEERRPSARDIDILEIISRGVTYFARDLFGAFTPVLTYPSLSDISSGLSEEYRQATLKIADIIRKLLSQAFLDIFATLPGKSEKNEGNAEEILRDIQSLLSQSEVFFPEETMPGADIVTALRRQLAAFQPWGENRAAATEILEVYQKNLKEIVSAQERSFEGITQYIDAVNGFLEGKELVIQRVNLQPAVRIKFDKETFGSPQSLSSGERQLLTMVYAASRMSAQQLVLIDEPEISLHVDWQEILLNRLSKQMQNRQIIVCTHSPIIGGDYDMKVLYSRPTRVSSQINDSSMDTETEAHF